ncbi:hypothetical protein D9M68_868360 [compost metagenome]
MIGDTLWFSCIEHADRFAQALDAAGYSCKRVFDDDFSCETEWRHGVDYDAPEVTEYSTTPYSPAGRKASRFQAH